MKVDFATFCHKGDVHRLHAPGQLKRQVASNNYQFNNVIIIYQGIEQKKYNYLLSLALPIDNALKWNSYQIDDIDGVLQLFGIDLEGQYTSHTDKAHFWKYHVVNHLAAVCNSHSDYIVFADNDCWMVSQLKFSSWVDEGIKTLEESPSVFIVSPNDGEPERMTKRFSQQMFLARTDEFRDANFNQPGWDGNVNIPNGPMPEYWAMLEGRMELHCRVTGQYRYVLGAEYRYFHHNRLDENGHFDTDYEKLGWR